MMRPPHPPGQGPGQGPSYERLLELMCDAELVGPDAATPEEQAELAALEATFAPYVAQERRVIERAVTGLAVAAAFERAVPLAPHLAARLEQSASAIRAPAPPFGNVIPFESRRPAEPAGREMAAAPPRANRALLVISWVAAAACLLFAVSAVMRRPKEVVVTRTVLVPASAPSADTPPPPPSAAEERAALLARADTTTTIWTRTKDPASKEAAGDVVWNESLQRGFMRFSGLALNDPKTWQYQLWIFDATGDARYPVDGGVFDIDAQTGDILVPIHAKIAVGKATMFAVTVEKPGGVVVSKRTRIVLAAKLT